MEADKLIPPGWPEGLPLLLGRGQWDGSRPTLLMVHGAGGCKELFRGLAALLSRNFNALALDLPGHGANPEPFPGSIPALGRWLGELVRRWGRPVALLGHSMGGAVVLEAARALGASGLLTRLILLATAACLPVPAWALEPLPPEELARQLVPMLYGPGVPAGVLSAAREMIAALQPGLMHRALMACSQWQGGDWVEELNVQAVVIAGSRDRLVPPELARALAQALKARFVLLPTGHMPHVERPGQVGRVVGEELS